ncbi:MAG: S24/S26 family peptidase [Polyangiales bacterium]
MEVVLRKVGRKPGGAVMGRLIRAPRKGSVVVIEFPDGLHEYVTTPVKRILRLVGSGVYYLQTANSRYRLEVRSSDAIMVEAPAAK